ncbi:MAG TPA: hypothetical protein VNZ57_11965, partial [Longimicrobiales bacterium]|nr:hypothetical protein [Longimicrobiales bacterium]
VSLMSWYMFERQPASYIEEVLPADVEARVSVEAGSTFGWQRWVGASGDSVGLDRFGASAPGDRLFREFGITPETVVDRALAILSGSHRRHLVGTP